MIAHFSTGVPEQYVFVSLWKTHVHINAIFYWQLLSSECTMGFVNAKFKLGYNN